jgi:hypothetical protein
LVRKLIRAFYYIHIDQENSSFVSIDSYDCTFQKPFLKMKIFKKILIILVSIQICLSSLLPCNETIDIVCSKTENYVSSYVPEPWPTKINILLKFYDIIGVDEADQTIAITLKAVFKWQDNRLDVNRSQEQIDKYV